VPEPVRRELHRRIAKKVRPKPDAVFDYAVPGTDGVLTLGRFGDAEYLYWLGAYEADTMGPFLEWATTADLILDIGARDGSYALLAAAVNPEAEVWAFEPDPAGFAALERNLVLNPTIGVRASQTALAAHTGTASFFVAGGNSSLRQDFRSGGVAEVEVRVERGDDFLAANAAGRRLDLLKIDTEGTEVDVLAGLRRTIVRDQPVVVCEVLRGREEDALENFFRPLDYRAFWLTANGLEARDRVEGDPTYRFVNYAFIPGGDRRDRIES
jgi:FkbM family methyltransferase